MNTNLKTSLTGLLLIIALPLLRPDTCIAQKLVVKPGTDLKPQGTQVITKSIDFSTLQRAIKKAGDEPLVIEVYPVKMSDDASKKDFDALLVLRDNKNVVYPERSVNTGEFNSLATHYVDYYRKQDAKQESFPWGYRIVVDKAQVTGNGKLTMTLTPPQRTVMLQYGRTPVAPCDSCAKCPPQCSGGTTSQTLLMATRMEKVVKTSYIKK